LTIILPRSYTSENEVDRRLVCQKAYAMKSAHRHQLETNALAQRLEAYIERYRPYASRITGVVIAVIILIIAWSYISGSSAARRREAWDTYNRAVAGVPPNLEEIHRAAQDYPGTPMQEMADVTWADAQVRDASRLYLYDRPAAMERLDRATSAYEGVVQSSKHERLVNRARLGLARIYEMQNHLDKAREQYRQVTGAYARYADLQAQRLEKPDAQEAYAWLSTAQLPRPAAPVGPGTPGQKPEFSPGEMTLPNASGADTGKTDDTKAAAEAFDNLLKSLKEDKKAPNDSSSNASATASPGKESPPSEKKDSDNPAGPAGAEKSESRPAEKSPATPATEKPAK
jgi:tetratricopeptide (TPR) repeat protein